MSAMLFLFNETFSMTSYDDVPACTISYMIIELWRPPPTHGGWLVLIPIIELRMLFSSHKVQHNPSQAREQLCNGAEQVAAGALSLSIYTRYIYTIVQAGCLYSTFSLLSRFRSTFKKHPIFTRLSLLSVFFFTWLLLAQFFFRLSIAFVNCAVIFVEFGRAVRNLDCLIWSMEHRKIEI